MYYNLPIPTAWLLLLVRAREVEAARGEGPPPGSQQAVLPESHAGHQGLTNWTPPPTIPCGSLRTIRPPTPTALAFYLLEPTPTSQFLPPVQLLPLPQITSHYFLPFPSLPHLFQNTLQVLIPVP